MGLGILALGQNNCHWRAQLMRGIRSELPLGIEGLLQPVEHMVKGTGQRMDFIIARPQVDATGEIVATGNLSSGIDNLGDRQKCAPCDIIPHSGR